jgi:hypothetical protein
LPPSYFSKKLLLLCLLLLCIFTVYRSILKSINLLYHSSRILEILVYSSFYSDNHYLFFLSIISSIYLILLPYDIQNALLLFSVAIKFKLNFEFQNKVILIVFAFNFNINIIYKLFLTLSLLTIKIKCFCSVLTIFYKLFNCYFHTINIDLYSMNPKKLKKKKIGPQLTKLYINI